MIQMKFPAGEDWLNPDPLPNNLFDRVEFFNLPWWKFSIDSMNEQGSSPGLKLNWTLNITLPIDKDFLSAAADENWIPVKRLDSPTGPLRLNRNVA